MGRTLVPFSMQVDLVALRFQKFRNALRRVDQQRFDRLLLAARRQMQAGVMAAQPNPFDTMALCMLLDLQRQLDDLRRQLDEARNQDYITSEESQCKR